MNEVIKHIEILPIQNGWIVTLPEKDIAQRFLESYQPIMQKMVDNEKSDIEILTNGPQEPVVIPTVEYTYFAENKIFFPTLKEATDFLLNEYK